MTDKPAMGLSARQLSAQWWRELKTKFPHHFTFVESYIAGDGGVMDADFAKMREWMETNAGTEGVDWRTSCSTIGGDVTYHMRDANVAMRFKLTFVGTNG